MIKRYLVVCVLCVIFGCSSQKSLRPAVDSRSGAGSQAGLTDTLSYAERESALRDSLLPDSNTDVIAIQLLERARQHYMSALSAEELKDSVRSASEFEYAIAILNELEYYPNIDNNCDFDDLSRSIIEDYEKYIANIDSLGPQASVFALRKKLNQLDEANQGGDQDTPTRIIRSLTVPLVINGHVGQNMRFFQERGRSHFERWLTLSGKYFPVMRRVFREEGIPAELMYLSMIESGLNPTARSWAKAVGLWQFVKGTGSLYGLNGNFWYDERRDFEKATRAAARHLRDLHEEFSDWYLSLAAYNSGAGRVYSAIRRSHSTDFWKMRPFLPRETRNYVPQYIAAAVMAMDPRTYGFEVTVADSLRFDTVSIDECVDLAVLAKCAKTDVETLRELNPELIQSCTPPGYPGYTLRVPAGSKFTFEERYAQVPDNQKRDWLVHKVKKGQTLASIARRYGITTRLLAQANHLAGISRISAGKTIVIPVPATSRTLAAGAADDPAKKPGHSGRGARRLAATTKGKEKLTYRIRPNDTLGEIAALYNVRVSDLRLWNEIPYGTSVQDGRELAVWVPAENAKEYASIDTQPQAEHDKLIAAKVTAQNDGSSGDSGPTWTRVRVKSGDNLKKIARRYGVTAGDIRKWNGLRSDRIMVGQRLDIEVDDGSAPAPSRSIAKADPDTNKSRKTISYTVRKGDTLRSIASTFGVSISTLRSLNNLRGSRIRIGQELLING